MKTVILKGKEYPIMFDLNVIEQIQKRYEDISKLAEKIVDPLETRWLLCIIINEAIAFNNFRYGTNNNVLTEREIGMLVGMSELQSVSNAQSIIDAFVECVYDGKKSIAE